MGQDDEQPDNNRGTPTVSHTDKVETGSTRTAVRSRERPALTPRQNQPPAEPDRPADDAGQKPGQPDTESIRKSPDSGSVADQVPTAPSDPSTLRRIAPTVGVSTGDRTVSDKQTEDMSHTDRRPPMVLDSEASAGEQAAATGRADPSESSDPDERARPIESRPAGRTRKPSEPTVGSARDVSTSTVNSVDQTHRSRSSSGDTDDATEPANEGIIEPPTKLTSVGSRSNPDGRQSTERTIPEDEQLATAVDTGRTGRSQSTPMVFRSVQDTTRQARTATEQTETIRQSGSVQWTDTAVEPSEKEGIGSTEDDRADDESAPMVHPREQRRRSPAMTGNASGRRRGRHDTGGTNQSQPATHPREQRQQNRQARGDNGADRQSTEPGHQGGNRTDGPTRHPAADDRSADDVPDLSEVLDSGGSVDRIVDELYRKLERKMRIEKKRRGFE